MTGAALSPGDKLYHRLNPDLGPGRVERVEGRHLVVWFPRAKSHLRLAAADGALQPIAFAPGSRARLEPNEAVVVASREGAQVRLADGRVVPLGKLWPLEPPAGPLERLARLDVDNHGHLVNRLDGVLVQRTREARGLGSFLGGRIAIFPHQLHVAERASASDPVRWLLADEVGLGKTIEACLVLSRLLRTGRADRTLVVAPSTLVVQWLGELWRKFHQVFVLLDEKRRADVALELGRGFNPFEAHRQSVIALEDLSGDPRLSRCAVEAGIDLLVVDEAHRLERRRGSTGNDAYRAIAPIAATARHVLLLSATPLEADLHGFFRLLELLRPDAYASEEDFVAALEAGRPLPPCTSATRRVDMGGVPPRVPLPVDLDEAPAQMGLTGVDAQDAADPRVRWLVTAARDWAPGGSDEGKALVFCHDLPTLHALKTRLEAATGRRVALFHEELTPERRDLEVAEFRRPEGPALLISTECGGEGRNFEFCRRLVLFDLPRDPAQVEQRIGRLDRVSRKRPVEVVYFRPGSGFEAELARLYEDIGLFREPLGGLERSLRRVELAIRKAEMSGKRGGVLPREKLAAEVREAVVARERAVYHHLHVDGYRQELAGAVLGRVPAQLDADLERFVVGSCQLLGFETAERPGARTWYLELGSSALIDSLPGVPGGTRVLGTFDREEAVAREELDFLASGHPLVEGLFGELQDGPRGRSGMVALPRCGQRGAGVLFVHARGVGELSAVAFDLAGQPRPDWAELLLARRQELRRLSDDDWIALLEDADVAEADWPELLMGLARKAGSREGLQAVAAFLLTR